MSNEDLFKSICLVFGVFGIFISWEVINIRYDVENILKKLKEQK